MGHQERFTAIDCIGAVDAHKSLNCLQQLYSSFYTEQILAGYSRVLFQYPLNIIPPRFYILITDRILYFLSRFISTFTCIVLAPPFYATLVRSFSGQVGQMLLMLLVTHASFKIMCIS